MFAVVSAAIAPAMAILTYFYLRDQYQPQVKGHVFRTFIIGGILVFPIMVLQYAFTVEGYFREPISRAFILYAFVEEFFKWFLLCYFMSQHAVFSRYDDGIVFGVSLSLSLGFATIENVFYLIANGLETAVGRALLPVTSHALYGVIMGYYVGMAKLDSTRRGRHVVFSLFIPIVLHGLYDVILLTFDVYFIVGLVPFMIALWWIALKKVKRAHGLDR